MAQFDVYRMAEEYLVDCQSGLLSRMATRFVVPLIAASRLEQSSSRLSPIFELSAGRMVLVPQGARTVFARELAAPVASLRDHDTVITAAIDILLSGV